MLVEEAGRRLGNLFTFVTLQPHRKDTTKNIKAIYLHLSIFCTLQPHGKDTIKKTKRQFIYSLKQFICNYLHLLHYKENENIMEIYWPR